MSKPDQKLLFGINSTLLVCGIATAFSGLTIMLHYHMGHQGEINTTDTFMRLTYHDWLWIHRISTLVLSLLMAYHIFLHWKWYKNVLLKKLLSKNKQVLILSAIFSIAFLTGFIPWLLQLSNSTDFTRKLILEIHDKIGLVLIIFLVLHLTKRFKWFKNNYARLND